jgi:DNA-binding protein YbaB
MPMTLDTAMIPAEDWEVLEQKIKAFNDHVKKFQREVKERLE